MRHVELYTAAFPTVRGDAVEIPVGQQTLRERAERDETLAQVLGGVLEPVALDGAVEDVVFVLVDDERHVQFIEDRRRPLQQIGRASCRERV